MTKPAQIIIIPFTTINHEAQKMLGISNDEYCVANAIYSLSHNPKSSIPGWCFAKKEYIAASVNVSRASVFRYIHKLLKIGLVELHPDQPELMRTTAKWYETTLMKRIEIIVEDNATDKPQSQNETENLNMDKEAETANLKMRLGQSQSEIDESQNETDDNIQGYLDKDNSIEINTSSYEEVHQSAEVDNVESKQEPLEGEVTTLPTSKPKKTRREPNPDGSYGKPQVNEVRAYFLAKQNISGEDCTQRESGWYWDLLLKYVAVEAPEVDPVVALKKFIDCLISGQYIEPSRITSAKRLYYNRHELMKKIRENKTRYSKLTKQVSVDYDNVAGGVAW